jgi:hypothetical protein
MKITRHKSEINFKNFFFYFFLPLNLWIYSYMEEYNNKKLGITYISLCDFLDDDVLLNPKSPKDFLMLLKKIEKEVLKNENENK